MEKIFFVLTLLCFNLSIVNAQAISNDNSQVTVFKITNFNSDGEIYDRIALENDIALLLYYDDNENFCFANVWRNSDSFSYGRIYSFKEVSKQEATNERYETIVHQFTWSYLNSYDSKKGEARVKLTTIYLESMVKIQCEIIDLNDNSRLILKGYLESVTSADN